MFDAGMRGTPYSIRERELISKEGCLCGKYVAST